MTGSMPGIAASTSETCAFASPPNSVEAPENSLAFELTWAWTSRPMITSQSPVAPLISFDLAGLDLSVGASIAVSVGGIRSVSGAVTRFRGGGQGAHRSYRQALDGPTGVRPAATISRRTSG